MVIAAALPAGPAAAEAETAWAGCLACHRGEAGGNAAAPPLDGLFRRRSSDPLPGFVRSRALHRANVSWTRHTLDRFLTAPRAYVHGMGRCTLGIKEAAERHALLDLLETRLGGR